MNLKNRVLVGVVSATLVSSVGMLEGGRSVPYEDVVGILTVCNGHTGRDVVKGKVYTPAECKSFLERDLSNTRGYINQCVNVQLSPSEFDAYTLFAYNVGGGAFCGSTLVRKLNQDKHVEACNELSKWVYAGGKYVQGLANRREYERKMCLSDAKQP